MDNEAQAILDDQNKSNDYSDDQLAGIINEVINDSLKGKSVKFTDNKGKVSYQQVKTDIPYPDELAISKLDLLSSEDLLEKVALTNTQSLKDAYKRYTSAIKATLAKDPAFKKEIMPTYNLDISEIVVPPIQFYTGDSEDAKNFLITINNSTILRQKQLALETDEVFEDLQELRFEQEDLEISTRLQDIIDGK